MRSLAFAMALLTRSMSEMKATCIRRVHPHQIDQCHWIKLAIQFKLWQWTRYHGWMNLVGIVLIILRRGHLRWCCRVVEYASCNSCSVLVCATWARVSLLQGSSNYSIKAMHASMPHEEGPAFLHLLQLQEAAEQKRWSLKVFPRSHASCFKGSLLVQNHMLIVNQ